MLQIEERFANYRILREIHSCQKNEIYLAVDIRLERKVALKIETACNEPSLTSTAVPLSHPNICAVYDVGKWNDRSFIAMEYVEGYDLRKWMASNKIEIADVFELSIQLADALEEACKMGLPHLDLDRIRILIDARKRLKILHFGIGDIQHEPAVEKTLYSFGALLYEMLTKRKPSTGDFQENDPTALARYRADVPEDLCRIVLKLLREKNEDRYTTPADVLHDLQKYRPSLTQPTTPHRIRPKKWNRWMLAGIFLILTVSLYLSKAVLPTPGKQSLTEIRTVLALPCTVYASPELSYLSDAIPGSLSALLARVKDLDTRLPPTSSEIDEKHGDLKALSEAYGIRTFVMSSVTQESDRLVLNVQLVDVPNSKVLWSNQYEGSLQDYIELTREAAEGIRRILRPMAPAIPKASNLELASGSDAQLAYLRGQFHANRYDRYRKEHDFLEARATFEKVLKLDPTFADAAAEIGRLYYRKFELHRDNNDLKKVNEWGNQALTINPRCSTAWNDLALVELSGENADYEKLLSHALKAVSYGPNSAANHMCLSTGLAPLSIQISTEAAKQANLVDPLYPYATVARIDPLVLEGRYKEGLAMVEDLLRLEPDLPIALFYQTAIYSYQKRFAESAAVLERLRRVVDEKRFSNNLYLIAKEAQALNAKHFTLQEELILTQDRNSLRTRALFIAPLLARYGNIESCFDLLEGATNAGVLPYDLLLLSTDLKKLENDYRYKSTLSRNQNRAQKIQMFLQKMKRQGALPNYMGIAMQHLPGSPKTPH